MGTQKQAAEIFGFSSRSVNRIWARYNAGVSRLLPNKKRGVQVGIKSNGRQAAEVWQLYSPELNPHEYVNRDVKTNVIGKKPPVNKA